MENNISTIELIKSIINNDSLYKILIYDQTIINKYNDNEIETKCHQLDIEMVDNKLGKEIRVIEICDELIKRQSRKLDNIESKLPLIVLNRFVDDFLYERELSQVCDENLIMMELIKSMNLAINSHHTIKYFVLSNSDISYFDKDIIYISPIDLLSLDIDKIQTSNHINLYSNIIKEDVSLTNIIPTYIDIMNPKLKYEVIKEDEQTYILRSKKYEFKVLLILNYNELQNDDINISKYDLIIEVKDLSINRYSVLAEPNVNNVYKKIKQVGKNFRR